MFPGAKALGQDSPCPIRHLAGHAEQCIYLVFEWPAAPLPRYAVAVTSDGAGWYAPNAGAEAFGSTTIPSLVVNPQTVKTVFAARDAILSKMCETRTKGLAKTGTKTLIVWTDFGRHACAFNYSDDEKIQQAAMALQAIAETMQAGDRLVHDERFDRLGLDADVDSIVAEMKDGRAIEVENIAPALQAIVEDERVMDRVRRKAARLLQEIASAPASAR
jgi:hypothetical protein